MSGKEFVDRINQLFSKTGGRKSDFYEACGFASNSLTNWAARNTIPSADVALKIAKYLNTSVEYLVTGEAPDSVPEDIIELAYEIYALPDVYQKIIFDTVNTLKADATEREKERQRDIG